MKKLIANLFSLVLMLGILGDTSAKTTEEPYISHQFPASIKIGDLLNSFGEEISFHKLRSNSLLEGWVNCKEKSPSVLAIGGSGGPLSTETDSQGNAALTWIMDPCFPITPGTIELTSFTVQYLREPNENDTEEPDYDECYYYDGEPQPVNGTVKIEVEKPVITTNAPASVKTGSTLHFTTALTNINVKNKKVADYAEALAHDKEPGFSITNLKHFQKFFEELGHKPTLSTEQYIKEMGDLYFAYQPKVEIIEGKELVKQSKQDYTNTMNTSETLTFSKTGTIKLKVTYHQINTNSSMVGEFSPSENKMIYKDQRYHPEKTITIQVTDVNTPPIANSSSRSQTPNSPATVSGILSGMTSSETISSATNAVILSHPETGITLDAPEGMVPEGVVLVVSPITGGRLFDKINLALAETTRKFSAFDISLLSANTKIQPNGKILISMPIPADYDKQKLTIYYLDGNEKFTELSSTVKGDTISFETDHFSTYIIAEKIAAVIGEHTPNENSSTPWAVLAIVLILLAGSGTATWFFFYKKKHTRN